jgi:hypothetical protein
VPHLSSDFDASSSSELASMVLAVGTVVAVVVGGPAAITVASAAQYVATAGLETAVIASGATVGGGAAIASGAVAGVTAGLTTAPGIAGAIAGAAATGTTVSGVVAGTVASGAASGAVTAVTTGAASASALSGAVTASMFAGPIGWAILGADGYTWDCWKPVVMDDSVSLSRGIALRDFYNHPNLRCMTVDGDGFVAENIRGEQFRLSPVDVDSALAFHATPI